MSLELNREELDRDPYLAACLRAAEGEVPMDEVDWSSLRASIESRAALPLARMRRRSRPRRWTGPIVSLAAAAGIAAVALVGTLHRAPTATPAQSAQVAIAPGLTIEDAMRADVSDQEFGILISGRENADALLQIAANSD